MAKNAEEGPDEHRVSDPDTRALPSALFAAWRGAVSGAASSILRVGSGVRASARAWVRQWPLVREYHSVSALPWDSHDGVARQTAAAVGLRAFLFGLILLGISISASTSRWLPVAVGVGSQVLWAGARFIILALLMPRGAIGRARLSTAYLAGLLPYAFAATWLLQLAALAVSAVLTRRGLTGAGVAERDAGIAIAWAFGGQAAIVVGGWAARALIAFVAG